MERRRQEQHLGEKGVRGRKGQMSRLEVDSLEQSSSSIRARQGQPRAVKGQTRVTELLLLRVTSLLPRGYRERHVQTKAYKGRF